MEDINKECPDNVINENKTWCIFCGARIIVDIAKGEVKCSKCGGRTFWDLDYLRATTPVTTRLNIECLPDLKIGDEFSYGRLQMPLNWRVIDISDGKIEAIKIDKYNGYIDNQPYNEKLVPSTWKTCTLRKYLNEEYLFAAFSEEERSRIIENNLSCDNNSVFGTSGGDSTVDKVFILSASEAKQLITDDYSKEKKWWLRTPGYSDHSASFYSNGVDDIGEVVNRKNLDCNIGVCPVIWINNIGIPRFKRESYDVVSLNCNKNDELEFGFDPHRGSIKWKVLDVKYNRALIISRDILREKIFDKKPVDNSDYVPLWETSIIRKWLNEEFLNGFFTEEEKKRILVTSNNNNNVEKYDKSIVEAHITTDKVFLLSEEEANTYFLSDEERICEKCPWFLRNTTAYSAKDVNYTGEINSQPQEMYGGIRPAMWIDCSL